MIKNVSIEHNEINERLKNKNFRYTRYFKKARTRACQTV